MVFDTKIYHIFLSIGNWGEEEELQDGGEAAEQEEELIAQVLHQIEASHFVILFMGSLVIFTPQKYVQINYLIINKHSKNQVERLFSRN